MNELLEQFLTEGRELIEEASGSLLALERSPDDEGLVNQVFRSVHTLKGNAGLFDYPALIEVLHAGEELMVAVRGGQFRLTPDMVDALLSASDVVRSFLDEIEASEKLDPGTVEAGRQVAAAMAAFLSGGDEAGAGEAEGPKAEPLPAWAEQLPSTHLAPGPQGPAVLFEYTPDAGCFFRGEDPLLIVAAVPQLRWRSLEVLPPEGSRDPLACRLRLRGISGATREEVEHALRYVEDDASISNGPDVAPKEEEPAPAPVEMGSEMANVAGVLIEKQRAVLEAWETETAPSVAEVLKRCFGYLGDAKGLKEVEALGDDPAVAELQALVTAWESRRVESALADVAQAEATEAAAEAAKNQPSSGGGKPATAVATPKEGGAARVLRVDQGKVDRLMNLIGQLVVAKNGLPYIIRKMGGSQVDPKLLIRELKEHSAVVDRITRELQGAIMEVRMLPVSQVFQRFPRLVRDVSRKLGKEIELTMLGEETQADKNIIEALSEPLVHLVRNALDHGIEAATERSAKGKDRVGNIRLSARNENETVVITIEDDGRGLDPKIIREKAVKKGVITAEEAERMSDEDARMLIFAAGFSTKEAATELSGRGVGMDVVRNAIEKVGGRLGLESEVGEGTRITLGLPLSMAVSHVMTVTADGQLYGIGMDSVVETVRYPTDQIRSIKGREALVLRDQLMPVLRLRELLSLDSERQTNAYGEEAILVLRDGGESVGLVVDEFGENIEVLVRPLDGWMGQMNEYSGSAVLGDGRLLLVLDMRELIRHGV